MRSFKHKTDLCIIGGGLAGICAAIAAARHGAKVVLIHDRPVFGGNASSEIRMWVCGARGKNNRETGIIEEILLENRWRNPLQNYSIWDSILYEKVITEKNITALMNCSCNDAVMDGNRIKSVKGWQLTTETWHEVEADIFADCSGDSILAPLSGAEYRYGRESCTEFNESIAPEIADDKTMGMSCLLQARQMNSPQKFIPPKWANIYETDEDLPNRDHALGDLCNFWWIEIGGTKDIIHDAESIRDELLKVVFGVWDHIKNRGDHGADNWVLDWVGFLPGKRESRRYVGDHILTQNDVRSRGQFDDIVAYGGWPMDDHHPDGISYKGKPTIFHPAPSPFGIPYRCIYSKNIDNLYYAGRNISTTHAAMSSTRVMATCALLGQVVGIAAAIAVKNNITPRQVGKDKILELQQKLMQDDCWLPGKLRKVSDLSKRADLVSSKDKPTLLVNGIDRPSEESDNFWSAQIGDWVEYSFKEKQNFKGVRIIFDSDLNRTGYNSRCNYPIEQIQIKVPETLVKSFVIEAIDSNGNWQTVYADSENHQRFVKIQKEIFTVKIRLKILETWGSETASVYSFEIF